MCLVLVAISKYCIESLGFNYVMLGQFSSDPIENRFGWYRTLSGSNYFISVRQVMESERKIKTVSLLKFDKISCAAITENIHERTNGDDNAKILGLKIASLILEHQDFVQPDLPDSNIILYVAGALVRSEMRLRNCKQCSQLLINYEEELRSDDFYDGDKFIGSQIHDFVNIINRGGLLNPSDIAFAICLKSWIVFTTIKHSENLIHLFLSSNNHLQCFLTILHECIENDEDMYDLLMGKTECEFGHPVLYSLEARFFNTMIKNFVVCFSQQTYVGGVSEMNHQKIRKLNG
jgi:hypothetical protein